MPTVWVLVLLCRCVQPTQTLFISEASCLKQAKVELYNLDTDLHIARCVEVK